MEAFSNEFPEICRKVNTNIVNSLGMKLARANKLIELLKTELIKNIKT